MKRIMLSVASLLVAMAGLTACEGQNDPSAAAEPVAVDSSEIVTGAIGPLFWPTGPITWNAGIGTWPIAVWAPSALNWLAIDVPGAATLGLTLSGLDGVGIAGFNAAAIQTATLSTLTAGPWLGGLTPYYGMLPWMNGLSVGSYYGAPGYVYGLGYYPYVGAGLGVDGLGVGLGTPLLDGLAYPGIYPAGLTGAGLAATSLTAFPFLSPTITSSALMFSTFPTFLATSPFLLNVTFSGLTAASMASLNVFTSMAATSAAITSGIALQATMFPIMGVPLIL